MMASGSRCVQVGMNHPYGQVQQEQSNYPKNYYPSRYAILNIQAYVRPPLLQQWRGPGPQGSRPNNKISMNHNPHPWIYYT